MGEEPLDFPSTLCSFGVVQLLPLSFLFETKYKYLHCGRDRFRKIKLKQNAVIMQPSPLVSGNICVSTRDQTWDLLESVIMSPLRSAEVSLRYPKEGAFSLACG